RASVVTLQFQLTLPLDVAEQEVQAAINAATNLLERQFGQMSGLKADVVRQSSWRASVVTLQFQLTLPLDVAEQEVQAAINAATNLL
ncbi:hypothetical protein C6H67_29130, partial [Klebsiella pneumoniae]